MSVDVAVLRADILADGVPGAAAAAAAGGVTTVLDLYNAPGTGSVDRELVPAHEVFEAIVPSEWASLTPTNKARIALLLSMAEVNVKGANTRGAFTAAFNAASTTRANLTLLLTETGSRAQVLFGFGVSVTRGHVRAALVT